MASRSPTVKLSTGEYPVERCASESTALSAMTVGGEVEASEVGTRVAGLAQRSVHTLTTKPRPSR